MMIEILNIIAVIMTVIFVFCGLIIFGIVAAGVIGMLIDDLREERENRKNGK